VVVFAVGCEVGFGEGGWMGVMDGVNAGTVVLERCWCGERTAAGRRRVNVVHAIWEGVLQVKRARGGGRGWGVCVGFDYGDDVGAEVWSW